MSNGKLEQDVRAKFFQDFQKSTVETEEHKPNSNSAAVEAMLRGFILEGDDLCFEPTNQQPTLNEQDWFYKL